jgi:hypothetical protein
MDFKTIVEAVSALGVLGFALVAVYALGTRKLVTIGELREAQEVIVYERAQKEKAQDLARDSIAEGKRLADAAEENNRLHEALLQIERERKAMP